MVYYILISTLLTIQNLVTVFQESNGTVVVEAENYASQELTEKRKWYRVDSGDEQHYSTASGKAYLEVLPDTRTNHQEKLIHGENFSNEPGKLAVLHYFVDITNAGRYYVWVRAFSTGTEDNGLHVGLDDQWVASGQRMQWCEDKNQWTWASKQRTAEEHCGVERLIYLDISTEGMHKISFSMREDGFEFDKWVLSREYQAPQGEGPPQSPTRSVKIP